MDAKYNRIVDHPMVRVALQSAGFVAWLTVVYALMQAAVM